MEFGTEKIGDIIIIKLHADVLDSDNAKEFKSGIAPFIEENHQIVFDMEQIKFVDSSGCGAILSCLRKLNSKKGDLKVIGVQKSVRTLFELVRMHRIIDILTTKEEAAASF